MRFVVFGAGAIGGVLGGRLALAGHQVVLIARGAHRDRIRADGLRIEDPSGVVEVPVPAVGSAGAVDWRPGDVVLLAVKANDTIGAVGELSGLVDPATPLVCVQNGVANEPTALRLLRNVYGVCVMMPAGYLSPGVVQVYSTPVGGILDVGRYPGGIDDTTRALADSFTGAGFVSQPRTDIIRWKYRKLLSNLGNSARATTRDDAAQHELIDRLNAEGAACLAAAGIDAVSAAEDRARRGDILHVTRFGERPTGSSSWQSLQRATGSIETDYLNGEIVLLGRLHGVPTPANELLQRVANQAAAGEPPQARAAANLLAKLDGNS